MRIVNDKGTETEIASQDLPQWQAAGWTEVGAAPAPTIEQGLAAHLVAAGPDLLTGIPGISDKTASALIAWASQHLA
jgi:hypothetical protein